jgi:cytochrome c biogenesis protein ResB
MKTIIYNLGLVCIAVLCMLSIFGAFLGAERAQAFFNSVPLAVFWVVLLVLLAAAILAFKNIQTQPMVFLMHLSCIFILVGGLSGSKAAFTWSNKTDKVYKGYIKLYPGQKASQAYIEDEHRTVNLGFEVGLQDFQILYYDTPLTKQGGMVKDYISDVVILQDGQPVAGKKVEVNHPLHYAGYHLYQRSYGQDDSGTYSILQIVSDRGVSTVMAGYALMTLGLFVHFGQRIFKEKAKSHAA